MLVLAGGLILTSAASYYAGYSVRLQKLSRFEAMVFDTEAALHTRMEAYLALLRGASALMTADPNLSSFQFRTYVERLRIPEYYPGIQGLGFTKRLAPEQVAEHEQAMRQQGLAQFTVWPKHSRAEYHAISYLEPHDRRNQAALGYDMFTEPVRRSAMERARDQGEPAMSGRVTLVQEIDERKQAGFLIYVPVYSEEAIPTTPEWRHQNLVGFIYSPFRSDDLFSALPPSSKQGLSLEVFDGEPAATNLLHRAVLSSRQKASWLSPSMDKEIIFEVAGRRWVLHFWGQPNRANWWVMPSVMLGGLVLSLLLFRLTYAEAQARQEVENNAARLRVSEQSLRAAQTQLQEYTTQLEKKVEERTAQLRESLESLEGVLYHVAHDLRAPLRAMASLTTILQQDYPKQLDERGGDYIRRIGQAAHRMDDLVKDLLAYGELSHMHLPLEAVDLAAQLDQVLTAYQDTITARQARVQVQRPLPVVHANATVVNQVLSHLIGNALKFVAEGRQPEIRVWAEQNHHVRLWVEDNGPGIKPEYQDRIFRIFERLHAQDAYPGTGIGLAIVKKGVERLGGAVGLESAQNKGSRFWVEFLPLADDKTLTVV